MSSMNPEPVPPQGLLAGKYRLIRMLGKGAMGEVWLSEEEGPRNFRRRVAVKRLLSTTDIGELATASFVAEAQVIAKLDHPNIVRLIELGTDLEGALYLVLDYVDGAALDRMIKKKSGGGALSPKAVAYIGREIALALESVHSLCDDNGKNYGVVHRDVTPSNILVSRDGRVRLSDFGVARISGFAGDKTETGIFKGKLPYMPPEQARGEAFDGRADIFALGITLFEGLLGQRPRRAETQTQLIVMIATERCPRVGEMLQGVPPALAAAIDSMTEIDPRTRIEDAGRLAADLDMALRSMGPNAVKEAKDELRARVELVAGPPTASSTVTGSQQVLLGTGAAKRDSWSVALHAGGSGVGPPPAPPHEFGPASPRTDRDVISSPTSPSSGGFFPQTLASPAQPYGQGQEAMQQGGPAKSRSIAIASLLGFVGAAVVTAMLLKQKPASDKTGATTAASAAPVQIETAKPTTEPQAIALPEATTTTEAPTKSASPKTHGGGGPVTGGGKPRSDTSAGASASAAAIDPATPGSLQVVVLPWGEVSVDGKGVGTTPIPSIPLAPGPHSVSVRNSELAATRSMSVNIKPGQPTLLRVDLRRSE